MTKPSLKLAFALVAGLALTSTAQAQWERDYGVKDQKDEGHRRVTPVTTCPDRGYIAIGTRDLGNVSLVYVIRTDNGGNTIWEKFYDVGADGLPDEGFALTELKHGGWVTTGTSYRGHRWDIHALQLNCDGKVLRSNFYYVASPTIAAYRMVGHDIRELYTGDGISTNPLDLAIAGYIDMSGNADAVLLRLDQNLNMIWNRRYDLGRNELFYGLTETRPTFSHAADIAVVGEFNDGSRSQALVARVDGVRGDFSGSADQAMALYGSDGDENFQSIVETQTAPDTGNLTMAGLSTSPGLRNDVYVVQTKPYPCSGLAQVTIGNETGDAFQEHATDLIEILDPGIDPHLGGIGSFALTGSAETKYSIADAFLLFIKQSSLFPIAARRYGDHDGFVDFGTSLDQNDSFGPQGPGFIIAGTTETDWGGSGDPLDLYLIQPTDTAKTGCEKEWYPDGLEWTWDVRCPVPHIDKFLRQIEVHTKEGKDDTVVRACN